MQKSLQTFQFKENETIASIGASSGVWEIWFASQVDNLTFYIQDIDEQNCNQEEIDYGVQYYEKLLKKTIVGTFIPVIGTERTTNLPQNTFDKVLIINSLHEFSHPKLILQDIMRILKRDAKLFIEEVMAVSVGEIHEGCGRRLFTKDELSELLTQVGYEVIEAFPKNGNNVYVFKCCLSKYLV
ncbi:methyltransferase domain-containing protein [Arcicella sp. LKC2W]|uniref:class I SAM-dependent methyltransferase n=1 Tax=Arcicella sp. LKC2W TaxID=2984198 RepID=UPI002B20EC88|nr:methyltransferase domain-containing protein [Arcicella sp. LKC2W]MEA5461295.1 methyltransferase domain-containing protein [Arcicella sp. LKC2W]